jgi:hypothetical protein
MTVRIQSVDQDNDSFGQWLVKTNQLIAAVNAYAVTVNSNTAVGNASITGTFSGNTLYAVSNVFIGISSSNTYIDGQFIKIQSSSTSNAIISYDGMLLSGITQYTTDFMTLGNTSINGSSVAANNSLFGNTVTDNLNVVYDTTSNTVSTKALYVTGGSTPYAFIGTTESNVQFDKFSLQIFNNPLGTYTVNSYMDSVDLYITNIYSNTITSNNGSFYKLNVSSGFETPATFNANTEFKGSNNQFRYGLASNGNVDIIGNGLHFSHQWYDQDRLSTNTSFFHNGVGGSTIISRNLYQEAGQRSTDATSIITSTDAQRLRLHENYIDYSTFTNGSPGTDLWTYNRVWYMSDSETKYLMGNVVIGEDATSDYGKLVVQGNMAFYPTEQLQGIVGLRANTQTSEWTMTLPSNSGNPTDQLATDGNGNTYWVEKFSIKPTDNIRINSLGVGTPASGLTGEIRATNNITAYYSSDKNLKENILPIKNALNKVDNINGVEFDWKDSYIEQRGGEDGIFVRKHDVGVIAQELEQVLPEVVVTRDDGYKAVNYEKVVALLIQAIKELKEEVDSLKANK